MKSEEFAIKGNLRIEESKKNKKEYYCKNAIYHNTDYKVGLRINVERLTFNDCIPSIFFLKTLKD